MKLVVDTNIIISALIKDSTARKIIIKGNYDLISIAFSKKEIDKHKILIMRKANVNETEFELIINRLFEKIIFLDDEIIKTRIKEAEKVMDKVDPDDTPFIAAALAINSDIWSDDKHFLRQNIIKIWKTTNLFNKIFIKK